MTSSEAVQPPLGGGAPENERARELLDAAEAFTLGMAQCEAARLFAVVEFMESYHMTSEYTGPGCEEWVQIGHDGTPVVAEFGLLELSARLGVTPEAAYELAAGGLDLKHRLPTVWKLVMDCEVPVWKALKTALLTASVHQDLMPDIDEWAASALVRLTWGRFRRNLDIRVTAANPQAAQEAKTRKRSRQVYMGEIADGNIEMFARLSAKDGTDLEAAISAIAATLPADPGRVEDLQCRRAAALGVLARQAFGQEALPTHTLVVHVNASDPALPPITEHTVDGVATVEKWGHLLTTQLPEFLAGSKVVVRPILDPMSLPVLDRHDPSEQMRFAAEQRHPVDCFPYGTTPSARCDLDHTKEYVDGVRGQTHLGNLAPLSRRAHRAKTTAAGRCVNPCQGCSCGPAHSATATKSPPWEPAASNPGRPPARDMAGPWMRRGLGVGKVDGDAELRKGWDAAGGVVECGEERGGAGGRAQRVTTPRPDYRSQHTRASVQRPLKNAHRRADQADPGRHPSPERIINPLMFDMLSPLKSN